MKGELTYTVWKGGEADVYIEADDLVIRPLKNGTYRVRTDSRQTVITVRKGKAEVESLNGIETVKKGNRMTVRKRGDDLELRVARVRAKDQFDQWSERRDKILKRGGGRRYPGHLYAYGGYPYHFGLGYYHYPYRRFGFGGQDSFRRPPPPQAWAPLVGCPRQEFLIILTTWRTHSCVPCRYSWRHRDSTWRTLSACCFGLSSPTFSNP